VSGQAEEFNRLLRFAIMCALVGGICSVDEFVETRSNHIVLDDRGKIINHDLASVTIYRR
jgi:hypothetical protein